jgi:restriction system protein
MAGDHQEHPNREAIETMALEFGLTDEERKELLPSGRQPRLDNRVGWALTYMRKAGLLEATGRGKFQITDRGLDVLAKNPSHINMKFLKQFPEYREFKEVSKPKQKTDDQEEEIDQLDQTPEEILESSYQNLRSELAQQLLDHIKSLSPQFFEKLVVDLLVAMGYGGSRKEAGERIGRTGDGGIDGIIKEDRLGLDVVCIQAKRWEDTVGRPVVQGFAGSLMGHSAGKGVLITTSNFSKGAREFVETVQQPKIVLINGEELAQLMIDNNIGVTEVASYILKKVDLDYFEEG